MQSMTTPAWKPERPRLRLFRLIVTWLLAAASLIAAGAFVPGASITDYRAGLVVAAAIAILNALLPPLVAALRLPYMLVLGFLLVLVLDALILLWVSDAEVGLHVDSFWSALAVALVAAGVGVVFGVIAGTNDDDVYSLRVIQRVARRSG